MPLTLYLFFSLLSFVSAGNFVKVYCNTLQNAPKENFSAECFEQLQLYSSGLLNGEIWALKMFDAMSKLPSGIFSGSFSDLGSFDQCIGTKRLNGSILGKYCLGYTTFSIPQDSENINLIINSTKMSVNGRWAACFPSACLGKDFSSVVSSALLEATGYEVEVSLDEMLCQTQQDANPFLTTSAALSICLFVAIGVIMVISTTYDIVLFYKQKRPHHEMFVAFSMFTNGRKIFQISSSSGGQLTCLNGIKSIVMLWFTTRHTYLEVLYGAVANMKDFNMWNDSWYSMYISSGPYLGVDAFFVVSGFLMLTSFMKARAKGIRFSLPQYYIHRYIRITPALAAVVLVYTTCLEYFGSGPLWPKVNSNLKQPCEKYWWTTLLYMQDYINTDFNHQCLGLSWYLNIDMQLFLFSPLIFVPLWKWPKNTLIGLHFLIIAAVAIPFVLAWMYNLRALEASMLVRYTDIFMSHYYLKSYARAVPWLVGILLGYVTYPMNNKKAVNFGKVKLLLLWTASLAILLTCVFYGKNTLREEPYHKWEHVLCITLSKPLWSLSISWIIFACIFGYAGPLNWFLSLPMFEIFNHISYSVYLLNIAVIRVLLVSTRVPYWFNDVKMWHMFCGNICFTMGLAVVWVMAFEYPLISIEKYLLGGKVTNKPTPSKSNEANSETT